MENIGELTLQEACTQARALEQAQSQSLAYESNHIAALEPETDQEQLAFAGQRKNNRKGKNSKKPHIPKDVCMWCGNTPRHDRSDCPAKDSICDNCKKPGHWAKVCLSPKAALGSIGIVTTNTAVNTGQHQQAIQQQTFQLPQQSQEHQQQLYQPPFLQQSFNPLPLQQPQHQLPVQQPPHLA